MKKIIFLRKQRAKRFILLEIIFLATVLRFYFLFVGFPERTLLEILPSLIFSVLTVLMIYFLAKELLPGTSSFLASFLLAISPWHLNLTSQSFLPIIVLFILILGTFLFLKVKKKLVIFWLGTFPLMVFIFEEKNEWSEFIFSNWRNTLFFDPLLVPRIHDYLNFCSSHLPLLSCRLIYNKLIFLAFSYFSNFFGHFSPDSLFTHGRESPFYLFEAPFFYLGLFLLLLAAEKNRILLIWLLFYPIFASLFAGFNPLYSLFGLPLLVLITSFGLYKTALRFRNKNRKAYLFFLILFVPIVFLSFYQFFLESFLSHV